MIQAIKNTTLTDLQVKTLNIREKELNYWSTTFQTMASQSALLAGFCYGGLNVYISDKTSTMITFGYLSTTTCGMAFGLLCITIASFCVMFGPGLALRGGDGAASMHKAVDNMKKESTTCFIFFILQLLCFHLSSFLLMWLYYPTKVAIIINIILMAFLLVFIKNGYEIFDKLYVKEGDAVTGQFQDFAAYENMYDLDARQMANRTSPNGRPRSGSDDRISRHSIGKLDLNQRDQFTKGGLQPPQGANGNPFELRQVERQQTLNQAYEDGNNMLMKAFRGVFKPQQ